MYWPHPGMLVHRTVYEKSGTFDLKYRYAGDLEWANRIIVSGLYNIQLRLDAITMFYTGGVSSSILSFRESRDIAIKYGKSAIAAYIRYGKTVLRSNVSKCYLKQ